MVQSSSEEQEPNAGNCRPAKGEMMAEGEAWEVHGPMPREAPDDGFFAPSVWPRYGHPLRVIVLGTEVVAVPVHWAGGRTVPCGAPDPCFYCGGNRKRRPQYNLAAWDRDRGLCVVLVLGSQGAARLLNLASAHGQLRGLEVVIHKLRERNRGGVDVDLVAIHPPDGALRAAFAVEPQLRRLFGVEVLPSYSDKEGGK